MNQSEPRPINGVQIYTDVSAPEAQTRESWHWRLVWNGKVVGRSGAEAGYASKAEAYEDFVAATNAIDVRLGKRTWRNAHALTPDRTASI